jgi:hypothetical protein
LARESVLFGTAGCEDLIADITDIGAGPKAIALARTSLSDARVELDYAVKSLSETKEETVMASSSLVDLLLRVVAARRHLEDLEHRPKVRLRASLR